MINLQQLLKAMIVENASDLHITVGAPPILRVNGRVIRVKSPSLNREQAKQLCYSVMTDAQKARFEERKEIDLSFGVKTLARFRANMYYQKGSVTGTFRRIPYTIPSLKDLGLPAIVGDLTTKKNGILLVTGPTGSGKTTTLASMIDKINTEEFGHILTIEDPVEYNHEHKNCIVNQREVGPDTVSFKTALKYLLRQDPDYVLIGEMRELETVETALSVAETGHLVMGSLHTNSAVQTISRLISIFPGDQQERVRNVLSFIMQGIVCQDLLPSVDGGRVLACEILIPNPAIRNLIRENKIHQIYSQMQMGQNQTGMMTMNQSIIGLLLRRRISMKVAFEHSPDPEELDQLLKKSGL